MKDAFVGDGASEVVTKTFSEVDRAVNGRLDFAVGGDVPTGVLRVIFTLLVIFSGFSWVKADIVVVLLLKVDLAVETFSSGFCSTLSCAASKFLRLNPFVPSSLLRILLLR